MSKSTGESRIRLELADAMHQAQVAFLDQVQQWHAAPHIILRDADDKPEVVFDQALLGLEIATRAREWRFRIPVAV